MEIEYNLETDEFYIVIPDSVMSKLNWDDGDLLEYELDDEVFRVFKL